MFAISEILKELITSTENSITTEGVALWICYNDDLDPSVVHILQDYGGLSIANYKGQQLWFFFTQDVLLALARLLVNSKFNPMSMVIETFPSTLLIGVNKELSLELEPDIAVQEIELPNQGIQVWVHPKIQAMGKNIPGLFFNATEIPSTMGRIDWTLLQADPRLPFNSSQGWYVILYPLGNHHDKLFHIGWDFVFKEIETIIQRNKFKYSLHENFLMLPIDNLRQLRIWVKDLLDTFDKIQSQAPNKYWPCVSICVDRKGLTFNNELPNKVGVNWNKLSPEFPYMSYRNAYLLGEEFAIQDINFSVSNRTIASLCTVSLESKKDLGKAIPVLISAQLNAGDSECCFYCGIKSHSSANCPTKSMARSDNSVWQEFNKLDINSINEGFREIEQKLIKNGLSAYNTMRDTDDNATKVIRAIFDINYPAQLRNVEKIWLCAARDNISNLLNADDEMTRDDSPAWHLLEKFQHASPSESNSIERELQAQITRYPRDHRLKNLYGFLWLEKGDYVHAIQLFKEAENLSSSTILQAWNGFLVARVLEVQNRLNEAHEKYEAMQKLLSNWKSLQYRKIVCKIKQGFSERVQNQIVDLVQTEPSLFNCFLIDPELERGHIAILKTLYPIWSEAEILAKSEYNKIQKLDKDLDAWFPQDHFIAIRLHERLQALAKEALSKNYVAHLSIVKLRPEIEEEMEILINQEVEKLKKKFKEYLSKLEVIRDEISWFPFPRALSKFNHSFNECAGILNWAFSANFKSADSFKRAQSYIIPLADLLSNLEKQLSTLRIFRDTTLFALMMAKSFLWFEIIGLILCFIIIPGISFFGDKIGLNWLKLIINSNFWELQSVLIAIVTVTSISIAALRTTIVFDKHKHNLLEEAKNQREQQQKDRLERVKDAINAKAKNRTRDYEDDE